PSPASGSTGNWPRASQGALRTSWTTRYDPDDREGPRREGRSWQDRRGSHPSTPRARRAHRAGADQDTSREAKGTPGPMVDWISGDLEAAAPDRTLPSCGEGPGAARTAD